MPAENDPAEPNALTQSLQLTCSLTPSSTVPSTRLVIIWLKRWFARPLVDPPLESEPVGVGDGVGVGVALGLGEHSSTQLLSCAAAGRACTPSSTSETAATSTAEAMKLRANLTIV